MKSVSVAIVGYGYWGPNLVRNFQESEMVCTLHCCDTDARRLARALSRFPTLETTCEFKDILDDQAIDAVVIATPPETHYELAKAALEHGKHVLVEKPLTTCAEHAEELCSLAEKSGLVLQVDHVFVYSPPVVTMHDIIQQGRLGQVFYVDSVRINLGLFQNDVNVLWDLAPHDLSIVDYLLKREPQSISAFGAIHANHDIEDVAYLSLDYGGGLIANFHVNWLSPVKVRRMMIGGSKQSLIYDDVVVSEKVKVYDRGITISSDPEERRQMLISYRSGDVWSPHMGNAEPLSRMVRDFVECIMEGRRPVSDGQAGLRVVRILDAAQRSIKEHGCRVAI